ncbi:MAG: DUF1800 domain-containing protein [Deltaproteobacteria bacterium]|nr:DUF1800 domain-containing protein [Deltaproteobacteria bacterium]
MKPRLCKSGSARLCGLIILLLGSLSNASASLAALAAQYVGVGADVVSEVALTPDQRPDFNIKVTGLRSVPTAIQILSDTGGIWKVPYNGTNWVIGLTNYNNGAGDLYFSQYISNKFSLQVTYADGSTDQTDVTNPPPPSSSLKAAFLGVGPDVVSERALTPDSRADFNIQVSGLRSVPVAMRILSDTNGVWQTPFNGFNWVIALNNYNGGNGNLHFSQFASNTFKLQVNYADGTSDQTDVTSPTTNNAADVQRFLEQATFGATPALTAAVQASGIEAYINQQLNAPMRDYPNLAFWPTTRPATCIDDCQRDNYTYYQVQKHFFTNALTGQDQLRQRVAFGLSQILVTSQVDVPYPAWMRSYQQLLYRNAFGNFRQLLYDVTLHPTMGRFLDMLNSQCQRTSQTDVNVCRSGGSSLPNENYPREILQLFSIGTFELNDDGTRKLNNGNPIPTYDQKVIEELSRVFTGWILAPALPSADPNAAAGATVPNYRDPMVQRLDSQNREAYHDRGSKVLLRGLTLAAGRTSSQDLNDAIDNIAYHPNVAPYMSKLLIQQLVMSNPSPSYVARIVAAGAPIKLRRPSCFR